MTTTKRLVNSKSGLRRVVCQTGQEEEPWFLQEPSWTPDSEVDYCMNCQVRFDILRRRHHCRRCGLLFCSGCCRDRVQIHRMGFVDPVRLCAPCAQVTRTEAQFFQAGLKVLAAGAPFYVRRSICRRESPLPVDGLVDDYDNDFSLTTKSSSKPAETLYNCRLAPDQRILLFEPHESNTSKPPSPFGWPSSSSSSTTGTYETLCPNLASPVDLTQAADIETFDGDAHKGCGKVTLHLKTSETEKLILTLEAPPEPSRKPSIRWISALTQGMKMMFESRLQANQGLANNS